MHVCVYVCSNIYWPIYIYRPICIYTYIFIYNQYVVIYNNYASRVIINNVYIKIAPNAQMLCNYIVVMHYSVFHLHLYGDDSASLYTDNEFKLTVKYPDMTKKWINAASRLLAVEVYNVGGETGMVASLNNGGCITDANFSWKCTDTFHTNWNRTDFNDSSWPPAYRQYNQQYYEYNHLKFSTSCPLITFNNGNKVGPVYCRCKLN